MYIMSITKSLHDKLLNEKNIRNSISITLFWHIFYYWVKIKYYYFGNGYYQIENGIHIVNNFKFTWLKIMQSIPLSKFRFYIQNYYFY